MKLQSLLTPCIDIKSFPQLAKKMPQCTDILLCIYQIDKFIQDIVSNILDEYDNPDDYYIKTEIKQMNEYHLLLYNQEKKAIMGTRWQVAELIEKGANKLLEQDIVLRTQKIISQLDNNHFISQKDTINWIDSLL